MLPAEPARPRPRQCPNLFSFGRCGELRNVTESSYLQDPRENPLSERAIFPLPEPDGMTAKPSIRFFNDSEIRAVWDKAEGEWRFAAVDVIAAVTGSSNPRNYWSVLKNRLKKSGFEPLTRCKGFKLTAADGKRRLTDTFAQKDIQSLVEAIPGRSVVPFLKWFTYSDDAVDGRSRRQAYALFES
ncbi:MAG: hypothetical protein IKT12_05570, partial [Thermoguttaceae bacterium]|nr:hypothetical protein [Thermoguttaceae bacterium]